MAELAPTDTSITTKISADLAWARHHLFLLAVVLVLAFAGIYGVESLISSRAAQNDAKWQGILAAQTAQTQMISNQLNQDEKNWQAQNAQQQQIIGQLAQTIAKRNEAAANQQKTDASLSAVEAAQRLSQQTHAKPGEVTAQGDTVIATLPVARTVVGAFDLLDTVQANLTDTQKQLSSESVINTNLQANVAAQKNLVSALRTENTDQQKACVAQVSAVKAQARKSKLKWFGIGYIAGFVSARLLGI